MATAFAIAMDMPVEELFAKLGHDGSERLFSSLPEPFCRRGHHVQELIRFAFQQGWSVTPIERCAAGTPVPGSIHQHVNTFEEDPIEQYVRNYQGVICCSTRRGTGHAVAFYEGHIFDPDGSEYEYEELAVQGLQPEIAYIVE